MATVTATTTPATLDSGSSGVVLTVVNQGAVQALVARGTDRVSVVWPGGTLTISPRGTAVTAYTLAGSTTLDVTSASESGSSGGGGGALTDGSVTLPKMGFDPATQAELDAVVAGLPGTYAPIGAAGLPANYVARTSSTGVALAAGDAAEADCTGGTVVIPLPAAPGVGAAVSVQKVDASANALIVVPASGGSINGDPNLSTSTRWAGAILSHKGSNTWRVVAASASVVTGSATTPGQVTGLTATASSGGAALSWTAPSAGSSPITDYFVEYKLTAGSTWAAFSHAASTATSQTVTGLTNGSGYDFRVSAVSALGTGTASSTASATPTAPTAPGAPTGLTATAGNAQVALSWTAPASNGGSALTDYLVEYRTSPSGSWSTFSDGVGTSTAATVTGLTNSTAYDFRVSAVNAIGTGTASSTVTATPSAVTVPGAPTALSATAGNGQASLTWTAPASNGGAAVTDYQVQYSSNGGTSWSTFSHAASTVTSSTVTGLTNGTAYTFRVAAVNSVGTGSYSATASATPAAPTVVVSDTFTRADTLTTYVNGLGSADTGQAWASLMFGISGNAAWHQATGGNTAIASIETGRTDQTVTATVNGAQGYSQLHARKADDNNYYSVLLQGGYIQKYVGGVPANLSAGLGDCAAAGTVVTLSVIGSTITLKKNGTTLGSVTDTSLTTGTKAGFWSQNAGGVNKFDDFSVA